MKIFAVNDAGPDLDAIRKLFLEYAGSLGISPCLQVFDKELAGLPGVYAGLRGRLLLATDGDRIAGCGLIVFPKRA
jgi:putative acetyltransferase